MTESILTLSRENVTLDGLAHALKTGCRIQLSDEAAAAVQQGRHFLIQKIQENDNPYYGVNTGFGSMYNLKIPEESLSELQHNLLKSHSAGAGPEVPKEIARITLLLKIVSLAKGYSGIRLEVVERLIYYYQHDLIPVMYTFGSLGASGDLAPLAHMSLTLIGHGSFYEKESTVADVLENHGLSPLSLLAKEGLALVNGTQFSTAYAFHAVLQARKLLRLANLCAALSIDGFDCNTEPFDPRIHQVRPHAGQLRVAKDVMRHLDGSQIASQGEKQLQDPYAFRCVPQVHGATSDTIEYAASIVATELNSATDNPLVFAESDSILSGGNFHAQPVALVMDYLAIALAELGSISERRTFQLISGKRGLSDYLAVVPGVQSGLMITQYTAAGIVNRNKMLCSPASVDSIVTSKGQEDHVSMGANAGVKLYEICNNCLTILAIECIAAIQAIGLRKSMETSPFLQDIIKQFQEEVTPQLTEDTVMQPIIARAEQFLLKMTDRNSV